MAVNDHGLEALKKAAEEVTPGDKSDYYIKTRDALAISALNEIIANLGGAPVGVKELTDFSDSVTVNAEIIPANELRKYLRIQNRETSASKVLYINFGAAAHATDPGSYKIGPGETFVMDNFVSTQAVNAIASGGAVSFTAKEG